MYPSELTFGVFDAAIRKDVVPGACVLILQSTKAEGGSVHLTLIDGGTKLDSTDDSKCRYFMRAIKPTERIIPPVGIVVRLVRYSVKRSPRGEPILTIDKMEKVRDAGDVTRIQRCPYPYDNADVELKRIEKESENAPYRNRDHLLKLQHQSSVMSPPHSTSNFEGRPPPGISLYRTIRKEPEGAASYQQPINSDDNYITSETESALPMLENPWHASNPYNNLNNNLFNMDHRRQHYGAPIQQPTESYGPVRRGPNETGSRNALHNPQRAVPYAEQYRSTGPVAHRTDGQYVAIKSLTSFLGRWVVKGRFVNVGVPRPYTNAKGEGKIWNVDLVDSKDECGSIRCTLFNKAVDKFQSIIKENEVYTVSRATIKPANKKFYSGSHDFELTINEDSEVNWIASDDPTIPTKKSAQVVPISQLAAMNKNTSVSVCGIILRCTEVTEITARSTGRPCDKRDITLVDESSSSIEMTLWGEKAHLLDNQNINPSSMPVLLVEGAKVDEYNGRKLSSVGQTSLSINPATAEAHKMRDWFEREGRHNIGSFHSLTTTVWSDLKVETSKLTIAQIKHRVATVMPESELEDKGAWFTCHAMLTNITNAERQFYWVACPTCGKKVTSSSTSNDGFSLEEETSAYCPSCQNDVENPVKKYLLAIQIADSTGSLDCLAMGDKGIQLMGGISADTLFKLSQGGGDQNKRFFDCIADRRRQYIFKLQAKLERYRDEATIKYRVYRSDPITGDEIDEVPGNENLPAASVATMKEQVRRQARASLDWIFNRIPKVTTQRH